MMRVGFGLRVGRESERWLEVGWDRRWKMVR